MVCLDDGQPISGAATPTATRPNTTHTVHPICSSVWWKMFINFRRNAKGFCLFLFRCGGCRFSGNDMHHSALSSVEEHSLHEYTAQRRSQNRSKCRRSHQKISANTRNDCQNVPSSSSHWACCMRPMCARVLTARPFGKKVKTTLAKCVQ